MLKNISRLEHKIGERIYHLTCDADSPLGEVKETLFEFLKFVGRIEDTERAKQAEADEALKAQEAERCCAALDCTPSEEICQ